LEAPKITIKHFLNGNEFDIDKNFLDTATLGVGMGEVALA